MWIVFNPKNSDHEAVNVPLGAVLVTFERGKPRKVPDALGSRMIEHSPELYEEAEDPTTQEQP